MATEHLTIRIDTELVRQVKDLAGRQQRSTSYVIGTLLDEVLRLRRHPGILFVEGAGGRRAVIAGTGLSVYEVVQVWKAYRKNRAAVLKHLEHLTPTQVDAALTYYAAFPDEIDRQVAENTPSAADLTERYPFIQPVFVKAR